MLTRLKDNVQKAKIAAGILQKKPLTGPWTVQIDLTNSCNQNCIGCWCHSPLLGELAMDEETKKLSLPYEVVIKLIDDLDNMGVRVIYFTGGGEPFMHPKAVEIMEYVKKKNMRCEMSNNFSLVTKSKIKRLVRAGVDNMNCSIWAGSPKAYVKTHPNKTEKEFHKIHERFLYMDKIKKKYNSKKPELYIYNVISTYNYDDFENMVEFAFKSRVQGVDFTPTDVVPGKTDQLMLNKKQREWLAEKMKNIWPKFYYWKKKYNHPIEFRNYDQFFRRISSKETEKGVYDRSIIGQIPCYAGWTFLRVLASGDVDPCLKAIKIPVGNIYDKSIKEIWNSKKQCEFRKHTIDYDIDNPYFQNMGNEHQKGNGCVLTCDNLGINLSVHGQMINLNPIEKKLIRLSKFL